MDREYCPRCPRHHIGRGFWKCGARGEGGRAMREGGVGEDPQSFGEVRGPACKPVRQGFAARCPSKGRWRSLEKKGSWVFDRACFYCLLCAGMGMITQVHVLYEMRRPWWPLLKRRRGPGFWTHMQWHPGLRPFYSCTHSSFIPSVGLGHEQVCVEGWDTLRRRFGQTAETSQ